MRRGSRNPRHLVSLGGLQELNHLVVESGELRVGALVTPARLEASDQVRSARPELLDAVEIFGTPQVRHRATVGGSLCTAASCGDLAPLLLALDSRVVTTTAEGPRTRPMAAFFEDHRSISLNPGELLLEVAVPVRTAGEAGAYRAFGLRAANFVTVAGVAAWVRLEKGRCAGARIALGAVAPTPVRAPRAEGRLLGCPLDDADLEAAGGLARDESAPISDMRATEEHRRELVQTLCQRALQAAKERAE
jgi:CO/xanthine dehydrogenase FAD-binding subunit